jgi:hydrogenase maturation protease
MTMSGERTLILGIGNPLMGDDGAGIQAVRMLTESKFPDNVTVLEAGTPGWGLAAWIKDWPSVIIVDAIRMGQKPGEWQRFDASEVRLFAGQGAISLHESDLAGGLALAQALDLLPERITFYGIEPEYTNQSMMLSPAVSEALPGLVRSILNDFAMQAEERD